MASITSANSILMLGVAGLFTVPQQLQGFAEDDMFSIAAVETKEVKMGVDGKLSAGYIPQIKVMDVTLQADSPSGVFFDAWYAAEEATKEAYFAFGIIRQPSVGKSYALTNGVLCNYAPMADAKKTLAPRKFQIKFESVIGAPL